MKRFIVIVLDGFGVGYMEDAKIVRPEDVGSNTCVHILEENKELKLLSLEKLGLMNIISKELNGMKFREDATFGKANLMHFGADTFYGHQEIMGTKPRKPISMPFTKSIEKVKEALEESGHIVRIFSGSNKGKILVVDEALTVGDNIEADLGQAYNITAALDLIDFEEVLKIGKIVRSKVEVSRVITFGGLDVTLEDILNAKEEKGEEFIGINAPKSGVYNNGYQCIHLGYGIDPVTQVSSILGEEGIQVSLFGKVADIVENSKGKSNSCVDTEEVLKLTLEEMKILDEGFICTNVQETDLCGHRENVAEYSRKLEIADKYIGKIIEELQDEDLLVVMADHGNDPTIGHSRHTREMVPLMITGKKIKAKDLGIRKSLSDVGSTVAEFFGVKSPQNGGSFLKEIR